MAEFRQLKYAEGLAKILGMPMIETARIWICAECGTKVVHCKNVTRPNYPCLCGMKKWRNQHAPQHQMIRVGR